MTAIVTKDIDSLPDDLISLPASVYYGGGPAMRRRANFSTLKYMAQSPAHYLYALHTPVKVTPVMEFGTLAHVAGLEPGELQGYAIWPARRQGNAWKAFQADNAGREITTQKDFDRARALAASVHSHPDIAPHLADGEAELTVLWTDAETGIQCRGRIDWISRLGMIADLKTTQDASPDAFGRQVFNFSYHAQAAFYQDGVFAVTGERLPSGLWAAESKAPHVTQAYALPDDVIAAGRALYRGWLRRLAECLSADKWPGYATGPVTLELPRWANQPGEYDDDTNDSE